DLLRPHPADVLAVEPLELARVEDGALEIDPFEREPLDQLRDVEDLLVGPGGPAEEREEVDHGLRQDALVTVLSDGRGAVALGEPLAVRAEDHGDVSEDGRLEPERAV